MLGIGDDGAIVREESGNSIVVTTDVLNAGVHFPESTDAKAIAYKSLAVNLSDLAAMGATPSWFTMTLSLPEASEDWLTRFASGLFELAQESEIALIGGDTVRGPLSIGIQAMGQIVTGTELMRSGACPGDSIYISGTLGDAALALKKISGNEEIESPLRKRLDYPVPRIDLGNRLRGIASSCIDISDGLVADLDHLLEASKVGANITTALLPVSEYLMAVEQEQAILMALTGGDDYELCFTVPAKHARSIDGISRELGLKLTRIGEITSDPGLRLTDSSVSLDRQGYRHFSGR